MAREWVLSCDWCAVDQLEAEPLRPGERDEVLTVVLSMGRRPPVEVELCSDHMSRLARLLGEGRPAESAEPVKRPRQRSRNGSSTYDPATVRSWALDQGHQVPARGRIPAEILAAYAKEHGTGQDGPLTRDRGDSETGVTSLRSSP